MTFSMKQRFPPTPHLFPAGIRSSFRAAIILACLAALPAACGEDVPLQAPPADSTLPLSPDPFPAPENIILITADDLGWNDLGCYGNTEILTPAVDRLAREGLRFENAFVTASSCSSSRASIITGQYPHTNGVDGLTNRHLEKSLPRGYTTLPSLLRDAGFATAIQGKWHVAPLDDPRHYGYQERLSTLLEQGIEDSSRAIEFIRENRDRRFYMELNFMNTHRLMTGEFRFDPGFPVDPDTLEVPGYWHLPSWPEILLELAKYYSQAGKMDSMIGEILDALDDLDLAHNTLVIFLSDNGAPFPGNKMTLYDRGAGTPLIFRYPDGIRPDTSLPHLVSLVDLMPTLLRAVGLERPEDLEGWSLLPLLTQPAPVDPVRDTVFMETTYHVHYLPIRAIRTQTWKYIRNYSDDPVGLDQCSHMEWAQRLVELPDQPWLAARAPEELYRLESDPDEQENLSGDPAFQQVLEEMRERLEEHMRRTGDPYLDE